MADYINMPSEECFALITTMRLMDSYTTGNFTSDTQDLFRKTQQDMAARLVQLAYKAGQNASVEQPSSSSPSASSSSASAQTINLGSGTNLGVNLPATPNTSAQPSAPATGAISSITSKLGL